MFSVFVCLIVAVAILSSFAHASTPVDMVKEAQKRSVKRVHELEVNAKRTGTKKLRAQTVDGSVPGYYLVDTTFRGEHCGGLNPEITVYKAHACLSYEDESGNTKYMTHRCFMDTKMGERVFYTDSNCINPDTNMSNDEIPMDTCLGDFMVSCQADASILNEIRHTEIVTVFSDMQEMNDNDLPHAKMFMNGEAMRTLRNIRDEEKMTCNRDIGYGNCIDTSNAESYARIPTSFQTSGLNMYTRRNGLGKASRVDFVVPYQELDDGFYTIRYPFKGWYDVYFANQEA